MSMLNTVSLQTDREGRNRRKLTINENLKNVIERKQYVRIMLIRICLPW